MQRQRVERADARRVRPGRLGIGAAGCVAVLVSVWGGIVPYVGPLFNSSTDGFAAWRWNLAHTVLALLPGAAGALLGFFVLAESRDVTVRNGRMSLAATAGVLLMVCGAWFAIGPLAWPVISSGGSYFVARSDLRILAYEVGFSIGTGIVLVCAVPSSTAGLGHRPATAVSAGPVRRASRRSPWRVWSKWATETSVRDGIPASWCRGHARPNRTYDAGAMRRWLSPRALMLHLEFFLIVAGCAAATWWQARRALGGNGLSWFYTFEWPVLAGIAIAAWWHLIHEDPAARAARKREREVHPAERKAEW